MSEQAKRNGYTNAAMLAALTAVALGVGACGNLRQQMGLDKQPPDEFRIVARPPLSMPPNYALRPPQPGAARPQEASVVDQARQTVFRVEPSATAPTRDLPAGASGSEAVLLRQAGADRADPNIREVLTREGIGAEQPERGVVDRLAFWRSAPQPGIVVDPQKEAQRLRENQALGRPINEGETAVIRRRRRGLFEGIL
ncbi:hypothetical protein STVA_52580 [Allostella vacuolata]|nr:hypothetical protein STVA_52580 [Stella vacuolata]